MAIVNIPPFEEILWEFSHIFLSVRYTAIPLAGVVYGIIGGIQCSQGQNFRYWLVGDWVWGTLTED